MDSEIIDIVIVGGGPAGLSAGLYAARDRYRTVILEKNGLPGGQIILTDRIENYPGWESISGFDLVEHFKNQAVNFGAELAVNEMVDSISRRDDGILEISVNRGRKTYLARAVILSPGSVYRNLGVPGEEQMRQATRVSYCATCDGAFYKDKHVLSVGGGNTAVEDTIYLAERFCKKVTIIHRRMEFRAQEILVEELREKAAEHNIEIKLPYVIERIVPNGDGSEIDHVEIKNVETNQIESIKPDGVFIFAGMIPNTPWLGSLVEMDESGYISCDPTTLQTSVEGIFVAGDCRKNASMQLATACADGVIAAMQIKNYLKTVKK